MNRKDSEKKVKFSRIARIDDEIRSGKFPNARELAEKMEVTERTILRDIDYLRLFYEAPIEYDYSKKGFYYSEPNFFIKSVILNEDELKIITIYDNFLKLAVENEENKKLRKVMGKIIAVLPENIANSLPFLPSENNKYDFLFEPTVVLDGNITHELKKAIKNRECIEVEYWVSDNRKYSLYNLKPLYIFYEKQNYYLLAWKNDEVKKPGIYSINRLKNIRITGQYFKISDNFKILDYLKKDAEVFPSDNKIYHFELLFIKEYASEAIEKTYYHNQIIEHKKDGSVFVTFRSTQLHEVFHWVLGQGHKVKVLNPPELVNLIILELNHLTKYYN